FFSSRRRHTRCYRDWSSDVCSSDLYKVQSTKLQKYKVSSSVGPQSRRWLDACVSSVKRIIVRRLSCRRVACSDIRIKSARHRTQIGRASCRERGSVRVGWASEQGAH